MTTPQWKIYRDGDYIASCKYAEDAAVLVGIIGGGIVKFAHTVVVWTEGKEEIPASESYDRAAEIMLERAEEANNVARQRFEARTKPWLKRGGGSRAVAA